MERDDLRGSGGREREAVQIVDVDASRSVTFCSYSLCSLLVPLAGKLYATSEPPLLHCRLNYSRALLLIFFGHRTKRTRPSSASSFARASYLHVEMSSSGMKDGGSEVLLGKPCIGEVVRNGLGEGGGKDRKKKEKNKLAV